MRIGTWNIQGISTKTKEVVDTITKYKMDIVYLTETKKKGQGNTTLGQYMHIWSGVDKSQRSRAGVSILLRKKFVKHITDIEYVNERILAVTLKHFGRELVLISVYAPTDDSTSQVKDDFYLTLSQQLDKVKNYQTPFLAGDFNGKVGIRQGDDVGRFGDPITNDSGSRLIGLCKQYNMKINNTFFQHKRIHQYTWTRPSLNQKSIIDFIILKQTIKEQIKDVIVKRGANCGSDHFLVVSEVICPFIRRNSTSNDAIEDFKEVRSPIYPRYKIELLKDDSIRDLYQRRLESLLKIEQPLDNIEDEHNRITRAIHQAALEALGLESISHQQPLWMTADLEKTIKEKNCTYNNWLGNPTDQNWSKYKSMQREVRQQIVEEKNKMWENRCRDIESRMGGSQSTEVWRTLRTMKTDRSEKWTGAISLQDWRNHYEKLFVEQRAQFLPTTNNVNDNLQVYLEISAEDLNKSLKSMKNGRAPGPGGIMTEMVKYGGHFLEEITTRLMQMCLSQNRIPKEWKISYITSLHKKGDRRDPNNYRGLSVNCTLSRLFTKIIKSKLEVSTQTKISEEQSGFTAGRSCVDNLFIMQQLLEKRGAYEEETHIAFIDLQKAYDSIPRVRLWMILEMLGVEAHFINIIKEIYSNNEAFVKVGNKLSEAVFPSKGLRQGCCLSPLLFNLYLEVSLRDWKRRCEGMGIPIGDNCLFTISFADDQVVIAQDAYDLEFMTSRLYTAYNEWGLTININKTEYLVGNSDAKFDVYIHDNLTIKQVDHYKYLGAHITKEGLGETEIKHRIEQGRKIIGALNSVWWDKHIRPNTKRHIGRALVESVVSYGCEVWTLKADQKKSLNALEMDYLRRSAQVSRRDRIRNENIRNRMDAQQTIVDRIERQGLKWFGHLLRMDEHRWPQKIYNWAPPGKRKRGRPRRTWKEGMKRAMDERNLDEEDAHNRDRWRLGVGMRR